MNTTDTETYIEDKLVLHRVKFFLFISLQIPSILLCLSLFIFFIINPATLKTHQNQALLLLLIVNFIQVTCDLPMVIHFYRLGQVIPATAGYCTWWTFLEYVLNAANEYVMTAICIQRHVLIFQAHVLQNRLKCFLIHHLPLALCIIYPIILYLALVVFYPCDGTQWDFHSNVCGLANCYLLYSKVLGTFDWVISNGSPTVIIIVVNVALVVRVIRQKRRHNQVVTWRKQRRMTIQLLSISCLYFLTWLPNVCIGFIQQIFIPGFLAEVQFNYIFDLIYLICLLLPWIYLGVFPEYSKWLKRQIFGGAYANNAVNPVA